MVSDKGGEVQDNYDEDVSSEEFDGYDRADVFEGTVFHCTITSKVFWGLLPRRLFDAGAKKFKVKKSKSITFG